MALPGFLQAWVSHSQSHASPGKLLGPLVIGPSPQPGPPSPLWLSGSSICFPQESSLLTKGSFTNRTDESSRGGQLCRRQVHREGGGWTPRQATDWVSGPPLPWPGLPLTPPRTVGEALPPPPRGFPPHELCPAPNRRPAPRRPGAGQVLGIRELSGRGMSSFTPKPPYVAPGLAVLFWNLLRLHTALETQLRLLAPHCPPGSLSALGKAHDGSVPGWILGAVTSP